MNAAICYSTGKAYGIGKSVESFSVALSLHKDADYSRPKDVPFPAPSDPVHVTYELAPPVQARGEATDATVTSVRLWLTVDEAAELSRRLTYLLEHAHRTKAPVEFKWTRGQ